MTKLITPNTYVEKDASNSAFVPSSQVTKPSQLEVLHAKFCLYVESSNYRFRTHLPEDVAITVVPLAEGTPNTIGSILPSIIRTTAQLLLIMDTTTDILVNVGRVGLTPEDKVRIYTHTAESFVVGRKITDDTLWRDTGWPVVPYAKVAVCSDLAQLGCNFR